MSPFAKPFRFSVAMLLVWSVAAAASESPPDSARLPVKRIVLFNSGVGYFEHQGTVEGDEDVQLWFNVEDVNDLLKSIVLQDMDGGRITSVTYGSRDPVDQQLKAFSIDLADSPTMGELLDQLRGERVAVAAGGEFIGTIFGVELQTEKVKDDVAQSEVLNLLTDGGLQSFPLRSVTKVRLLDDDLNRELQESLAILAEGRRSEKRSVTLRCTGAGRRIVRVGYVLQTPVWKTTYRLVLEDDNSARLQGWAVVENTGDFSWDKIALTLVSGRPISFQMDLYEPLYIQRPTVDLEVLGSPRPRIYAPGERRDTGPQMFGGFGGGGMGAMGGGMGESADRDQGARPFVTSVIPTVLDPLQGVVPGAEGSEVGEFFQYQIEDPVSLDQRQSALLPIVSETIKTERLSVFTVGVCERHPRHALNVTNDTAVYLMSGPITVLDQRTYAGDARIRDLPPGQERLISYAVDLDVTVNTDTETSEPKTVSAQLNRGMLVLGKSHRRTHHYGITNRGDRARRILIEHPRPKDDWKLAEPAEPTESTSSYLRFAVDVNLDETAELEVVEERRSSDESPLRSMDSRDVANLADSESIDMTVRTKLLELLTLRDESHRLQSELNSLQSTVVEIHAQQRRIRENMTALDRTSPLYQRYVASLDQQEGQLEDLATKMQITSKEIAGNELELQKIVPENE